MKIKRIRKAQVMFNIETLPTGSVIEFEGDLWVMRGSANTGTSTSCVRYATRLHDGRDTMLEYGTRVVPVCGTFVEEAAAYADSQRTNH